MGAIISKCGAMLLAGIKPLVKETLLALAREGVVRSGKNQSASGEHAIFKVVIIIPRK